MMNCNNNNRRNILTISFIVFTSFLIQCTKCDILVFLQSNNQIIEQFRDLPAHFGSSLPSNGMRVLAVAAEPIDGCGEGIAKRPTPSENTTIVKFIAVMQRMNCSFEEKVRNAQNAGFDAAIVHNLGSNELEQMSAENGGDIYIPSIFVGETTGTIIRENYLYKEGFALLINDELPFNINTHLILPFTIVVGLCFFIMIGFMVVRCVRERRRMLRHRLPKRVLKKIPIIKFTKGLHYDTCAICLDDYVEGEKLRVLPCAHAYHSKCIDPWLTKNRRVCPICKRKVFARGERRQRRRSSSDNYSASDADDTTPLLNPVENSAVGNNAITHGTFEQSGHNQMQQTVISVVESDANMSATDDELLGSRPAPQQRFNPFDRLPNLPPSLLVANAPQTSWQRIKSLFQRPTSNDELIIETGRPQSSSQVSTLEIARSANSQSTTTVPCRTSSNSLLNTNLSGSFKDDDDQEGMTTDDDLILRKKRVPTRAHSQPLPTSSTEAGTSSRQPQVVAALPNPNFNPDVQAGGRRKRPRNGNFVV